MNILDTDDQDETSASRRIRILLRLLSEGDLGSLLANTELFSYNSFLQRNEPLSPGEQEEESSEEEGNQRERNAVNYTVIRDTSEPELDEWGQIPMIKYDNEYDVEIRPLKTTANGYFCVPGFDLTHQFPLVSPLPSIPIGYVRLIRFIAEHYSKVQKVVGYRTARMVGCLWNAHRRRNEILDKIPPGAPVTEPVIEVGMLEEFVISIWNTIELIDSEEQPTRRRTFPDFHGNDNLGYEASDELDAEPTPLTLPEPPDLEWGDDFLPLLDDLLDLPYGFRNQTPEESDEDRGNESDEIYQQIRFEVEWGARMQRLYNRQRARFLCSLARQRLGGEW